MPRLHSIHTTWPVQGLRYPTSDKPNKKHIFVPFKSKRVADAIRKALQENLATCNRDTVDVAFATFIDAATSVLDQFQHHDIMAWVAMIAKKVWWMQNGPGPAAQLALLMALATARVAFNAHYFLETDEASAEEPAPPPPAACRTAVAIERLLASESDGTASQAPQILVSVFTRGCEPMVSHLSGLRDLLAFTPAVRGEVTFGQGVLVSNTQMLTMAEPGEEGRADVWIGRLTRGVGDLNIAGRADGGIGRVTSGVADLSIADPANLGPREAVRGDIDMGEGDIGAEEEEESDSDDDDDEMIEGY